MTPKVSVIVNTVDRPDDLRRCLNAVFNQTYQNFEVVVVNNGKEGETRRLLKQFQREHENLRVIEDRTKKLSYLFNVGWKNADPKAEIFAYCADDTEPDKKWLETIVDWLTKNPNSAVSGPTLSTTQPPGEMFALYNMMKKRFFLRPLLRLYEYFVMEDKTFEPGHWPESGAFTMGAGIPLPHIKEPIEIDLLTSGNMGITREAMEKVSGFDENFLFNHADGDLFIRLKRASYKMVFHPAVKVLHHMRFGPTRFPEIMGRDTAFYYLKDVRPKSLRGWIGAFMNLTVFLTYWIFKAVQQKNLTQLRGISGFFNGIYVFFKTNTPERNRILKKLAVLGGFLLLFGQSVRKLYPFKGMLGYGDAWPMPLNSQQAWEYFRTAWDTHNPGINMPGVTQISFLLAPISLLLRLVSPEKLSWLIYIILPLPLCFISAYWFSGKITSSKIAKFLAAFIYSVNPVTLGEIVGGSVTTLYAHALLPPVVWYLHKNYQDKGFNILFVVFTTLGYIASDHILIWIAPLLVLYTIKPIFGKEANRHFQFIKNVLKSIVVGILIFLLTLPYTLYYAKIALPFLGGGVRLDVLEFLVKNVKDTYNHWGVLQAVRFGGNIYENLYTTNDLWARAGFIIPFLAFLWIPLYAKDLLNLIKLLYRRIDTSIQKGKVEKRIILALASSVGALLIVLFIANARGSLLCFLAKVPFLLRFRNPVRPSLLLAFCYLPLIALTIDKISSFKLPGFISKMRLISLVGVMLVTGYFSKPFFSGDLTMSKNRGTTYTIAPYYYEVGAWLNEKREKSKDNFRTLWLPWNHEDSEMKLRWIDPYAYSVPINYGAYTQNGYLDGLIRVYGKIGKEDRKAPERLALGGVKYIILNKNSNDTGRARYEYEYQTPWLLGVPGDFERILTGESMGDLLEEVHKASEVIIYKNKAYSKEKVDPILAGLPPEKVKDMQRTKDITISVAAVAWVLALAVIAVPIKRRDVQLNVST